MKIILKERRRFNWYLAASSIIILILSVIVVTQYFELQRTCYKYFYYGNAGFNGIKGIDLKGLQGGK